MAIVAKNCPEAHGANVQRSLHAVRAHTADERAFQVRSLRQVSRTFALTIPELPTPLANVVGHAYLWCRIADTIEDESTAPVPERHALLLALPGLLLQESDPQAWRRSALASLSSNAPAGERRLIQQLADLLAMRDTLSPEQQCAIHSCLQKMCEGMVEFSDIGSKDGLADLAELHRYCYFVAGVVGEMLTQLFCEYSAAVRQNEAVLQSQAASFGNGLQLTNILKDVWSDYAAGRCWLPRALFLEHGFDLESLPTQHNEETFDAGLASLTGVAHGHLRNALTYALAVPPSETGIRRFCLLPIGFAMMTLRKLNSRNERTETASAKISKMSVAGIIGATRVFGANDPALDWMFNKLSSGLPLTAVRPAELSGAPPVAADRCSHESILLQSH